MIKKEYKKRFIKESYINSNPFPFIVLDDFFEVSFLEKVLEAVEECDREIWWKYNNTFEKKFAYNNYQKMNKSLREYFDIVNSLDFVKSLESMTGIKNIISDPSLYGGGIHKIKRGGKLDIHEDFNFHRITGWKRRLNIITYLNKDWKEEYGGHTELWHKSMKNCAQKILPIFNRTIIFCVDKNSFHGHPDPLNCPDDRKRLSLATYYYTMPENTDKEIEYKSTSYKKRPNEVTDPKKEKMRKLREQGRLRNETE